MKLYKTIYLVPALLMGAFASSCDDIAEDDRYIPFEKPEVEKRVLVMEFSGQMCVNCPTGAIALHNASDAFPGKVVILTMHPTTSPYSLKDSNPLAIGLTNEYSEYYYQDLKPTGFPVANVDGGLLNYNNTEWGTLIVNGIEQTAPMAFDLSTAYDSDTRTVDITWDMNFNDMHDGECYVALWITESHLMGFQMTPTGSVKEYDHQHILRQTLTEPWGDVVKNGEVAMSHFVPEDNYTGTLSVQLDEKWVAENCHVAAAIFNGSHKVLQAAEAPVIAE